MTCNCPPIPACITPCAPPDPLRADTLMTTVPPLSLTTPAPVTEAALARREPPRHNRRDSAMRAMEQRAFMGTLPFYEWRVARGPRLRGEPWVRDSAVLARPIPW